MEPNNNGSLFFHITKRWLQEFHLRRCGGRRARNAQTSSLSDNRQDKSLFDRSSSGPSLTAAVRSDNLCLFVIPLTGQLRCARNTVTNADKSGSWGACAFIITTFETNGKASRERERERESLSLPLRLHTRFVHLFCRDCSWGRNVRQALPSKRTGVIRIGMAQARSGTFHLKHE